MILKYSSLLIKPFYTFCKGSLIFNKCNVMTKYSSIKKETRAFLLLLSNKPFVRDVYIAEKCDFECKNIAPNGLNIAQICEMFLISKIFNAFPRSVVFFYYLTERLNLITSAYNRSDKEIKCLSGIFIAPN